MAQSNFRLCLFVIAVAFALGGAVSFFTAHAEPFATNVPDRVRIDVVKAGYEVTGIGLYATLAYSIQRRLQ